MQLDPRSIATGALAGLASALLVQVAVAHMSTSAFFIVLAGMPVFIAGLGFGIAAGIAGLVASFALLSLMVSPLFALSILALPQLPALWMSRLANMARPAAELGGPDNVMAWYPLSDMLGQLCNMTAVLCAGSLLLSGYDRPMAASLAQMLSDAMSKQDPSFVANPGLVDQIASLYYFMLPTVQASQWVLAIFAAYYFSAIIVRIATKTLRPREDMPSALRMTRSSIYSFGAGMAVLILGTAVNNNALIVAGASFAGAFGLGFMLSGLAAFHMRTRGKSWRTPALVLAYLTLSISGIAFVIAGLFDTRRAIALTPVGGAPKDNQEH